MAGKTSRRDFLRVKPGVGESAGAPPGAPVPAGASASGRGRPESPEGASLLLSVSRPAMACRFEVLLSAGRYPNGTEAAVKALDLVEDLEGQLSYFRPASQLNRLNLVAADGPVAVGQELFDLLSLSIDLYRQTGGAFDVTAAPIWEVWGFARRGGKVPAREDLADALRHVGSHRVELDPERKTVYFKEPGVRLNLGSLGKGYALDRAAALLADAGVHDFLFHGGQSSVLARGSRIQGPGAGVQGPEDDEGAVPGQTPKVETSAVAMPESGWTVGVRHPLRPDRRIGEVRLRNRSLGTSGSTFQYFRHQGRRYGHILDPRTGMPAEGVLAATVVAPSATLADALSTAFFVMGPQATEGYCKSHPGVSAVLVCPAEGGPGFRVHAFGFQDELVLLESG